MERMNRTIKAAIHKVQQEGNVREWPDIIEAVLFAINSTKQSSTGFSPFFMLYNRHPILPIDVERAFPVDAPVLFDPNLDEEADEVPSYDNEELQLHLQSMLKVRVPTVTLSLIEPHH